MHAQQLRYSEDVSGATVVVVFDPVTAALAPTLVFSIVSTRQMSKASRNRGMVSEPFTMMVPKHVPAQWIIYAVDGSSDEDVKSRTTPEKMAVLYAEKIMKRCSTNEGGTRFAPNTSAHALRMRNTLKTKVSSLNKVDSDAHSTTSSEPWPWAGRFTNTSRTIRGVGGSTTIQTSKMSPSMKMRLIAAMIISFCLITTRLSFFTPAKRRLTR
mmetsp:Transcript_3315/g.10085  ORF Transcript_3315/g.10085 Transcript_3315/m.10085 type:complete len:212 (+) Transcript_3315:738-1373(+)